MPNIHYTPIEGLNVGFFTDAELQPIPSEKEGRPIYKEVEFVSVIPAGDAKTIMCQRVDERHKARWPEIYKKFKSGIADTQQGTPLKEWAAVSASVVRELEHYHVYTVEQLAELSDEAIMFLGRGMRELVTKAKAMIAKASNDAGTLALAAENQRLKDQIAALEAQTAETNRQMLERMAALESANTRSALAPDAQLGPVHGLNNPQALTASEVIAQLNDEDEPRRGPGRPPKARG